MLHDTLGTEEELSDFWRRNDGLAADILPSFQVLLRVLVSEIGPRTLTYAKSYPSGSMAMEQKAKA